MEIHYASARSLRTFCLVVTLSMLTSTMAQQFNSGALIPVPGSVPAFPVETDFSLPRHYTLPDSVDNSRWFPPPGNQRRQASCTSWTLSYAAMSYWWNRAEGRTYTPLDTADPATTYSPAFLFNILKQRSNAPCTTGVNFSDIVQLSNEHGTCTWEQMPYDTTVTSCQAPVPHDAIGAARLSLRPEILDIGKTDFHQWQFHLAQGRPIILEFAPDSTFFHGGYATHGDSLLNWHYTGDGTLLLGHAVVCTGYTADSLFTCMNSYGKQWGGHGYFTATWDMLKRRCYGAHVLVDDTSGATVLEPAQPSDSSAMSGPIVKKRINRGQVFRTDRSLIRLGKVGRGQKSAMLQLYRPLDRTLKQVLRMRPGQAYTIYADGMRTVYSYQRAGFVGRWLKRPLRLSVTTTDANGDPYLARRDAQLRRLHEGLRR